MSRILAALLLCALPVQAQLSGLARAVQTTNNTTSPTAITGLGWVAHPNTSYGFTCVITHQGTATSGPRFSISGPSGATHVNVRWVRSTSGSAQTQSNDTAFSASAQTAAITSSGNTGVLSSLVYGTLLTGSAGGEIVFGLTSSTAGQTVTVFHGSNCIVY